MIFAEIVRDLDQTLPRQKHVLSKYAGVCLSWQHRFERLTFERLQLSQSCLPYLGELVHGEKIYRLGYAKLIWLRIRLDKYDCTACHTAEDEETIKKYAAGSCPACLKDSFIPLTWLPETASYSQMQFAACWRLSRTGKGL